MTKGLDIMVPALAALVLVFSVVAPATALPEDAADSAAADGNTADSAAADTVSPAQDRVATSSPGIDARRNRKTSFEVRLGGNFLVNSSAPVTFMAEENQSGRDYLWYVKDPSMGALVQLGVGADGIFDFRAGCTFPNYLVGVEFEFNLIKTGRFIPTIGFSFGILLSQFRIESSLDVGLEFWILDWLAAFAKVGISLEYRGRTCEACWSADVAIINVALPVSFGLEFRY